jgi:signal transduction histidine kinase
VVLAVTREIFPDEQAKGRADVLAAFAGHAALVVANTLLFEEVEQALRRQIDLNRQKDEFVAAVSHELRTPLTTVLGVVSTARRLRSRLEPDALDELLGRAAQQGDRLRRLIDELLLVAAAEHGTLAVQNNPVDPRDLAEEVRVELDGRAGGRLRVRTGGDVGRLVTDGDKLRQILINLVENAVKYAPDGPIEVNVRRVGQTIEWCVMDHGPGIPAEERDRVFDCFVQLDQSSTRRQGGTGLGLYLCRRLADLLGGDLELTETPGGGCRFTLRLPAPSTPSASPADPMSPQEASVPAPTQGAAA